MEFADAKKSWALIGSDWIPSDSCGKLCGAEWWSIEQLNSSKSMVKKNVELSEKKWYPVMWLLVYNPDEQVRYIHKPTRELGVINAPTTRVNSSLAGAPIVLETFNLVMVISVGEMAWFFSWRDTAKWP